jgi:hypothetical protein
LKLKEKEKDKEELRRSEPGLSSEQSASSPISNLPAFVPYYLYSQLLDRVFISKYFGIILLLTIVDHICNQRNAFFFNQIAVLEENQAVLQRKINQLSEQLTPNSVNAVSDKD